MISTEIGVNCKGEKERWLRHNSCLKTAENILVDPIICNKFYESYREEGIFFI